MGALVSLEDALPIGLRYPGPVIDDLDGDGTATRRHACLDVRTAVSDCVRQEVPENLAHPDRVSVDNT